MLMQLAIHCLSLDICSWAKHLPDKDNGTADMLSVAGAQTRVLQLTPDPTTTEYDTAWLPCNAVP